MLVIALIFCLACGALAQTPGFGHCPDVDVLATFDQSDYGGVWYENRRNIPNIHESNTRCMTANFSRIDNDTIKLVIHSISTLTGNEFLAIGSGQIDTGNCMNSTDCGKFIFEFPLGIIGHERRSYWIIDTDYTSYSVVWSCTSHFLTHTKYLWILTREAEPSDSVLELVTNILLKNQIDNVPLHITDQKNCP